MRILYYLIITFCS